MIADIDKKKIRKVVKETEKKDVKIRNRLEEEVIKLVDVGASNLLGHFKDGILKGCDEVCRKKRERSKGDTWWWKGEVKETVSRKKDAHKAMCWNSTRRIRGGIKA